jgi:hypothetical protein
VRLDLLDRRVVGAVRYLDATTGLPIRRALDVAGEGVRLMRNLRGLYVLSQVAGLEQHELTFPAPPRSPGIAGMRMTLTVSDPAGRFLPRSHTVRLPRDPDPAHADQEGSLFRTIDVPLYPSPAALVSPGWSVIRATVVRQGSGEPLPGALLRVVRTSDSKVLARGVSEWRGDTRGEALVAIAGVPITTWGDVDDPVVVNEVPATLEVYFDPQFDPAGDTPDPDRLETARAGLPSATASLKLASGRGLAKTLAVAVP